MVRRMETVIIFDKLIKGFWVRLGWVGLMKKVINDWTRW